MSVTQQFIMGAEKPDTALKVTNNALTGSVSQVNKEADKAKKFLEDELDLDLENLAITIASFVAMIGIRSNALAGLITVSSEELAEIACLTASLEELNLPAFVLDGAGVCSVGPTLTIPVITNATASIALKLATIHLNFCTLSLAYTENLKTNTLIVEHILEIALLAAALAAMVVQFLKHEKAVEKRIDEVTAAAASGGAATAAALSLTISNIKADVNTLQNQVDTINNIITQIKTEDKLPDVSTLNSIVSGVNVYTDVTPASTFVIEDIINGIGVGDDIITSDVVDNISSSVASTSESIINRDNIVIPINTTMNITSSSLKVCGND